MITLHYLPGAASLAPHILLLEAGAAFKLQLVDGDNNAHKSPAYLALNPTGLIPVLVDGDLVLYETVAIGLHLADTHPAAGLAPALGSAARAHFYKWLVWLTNTMQATLIHYFYPERMVDEGNAAAVAQVKAHAQARVGDCLAQIDAQLAAVVEHFKAKAGDRGYQTLINETLEQAINAESIETVVRQAIREEFQRACATTR